MNAEYRDTRRRQQFWLRLTAIAAGASLLALVVGTALFARQAQTATRQAVLQADLNVRLRVLQTLMVTLGDAETGQRGYLLTGQPEYLEPYAQALGRMPDLLKGLDHIPVADAALAPHVQAIQSLIAKKFAELAETIRLHDQGRGEEALALLKTGAGRAYAVELRQELLTVLTTMRDSRDAMTAELAASTVSARLFALAAVSTLLALVVLMTVQALLLLSSRRHYERALQASEEQHRALVEEQTELVSLARGDGTLVYVNPAYASHFGKQTQDMLGRNLLDFVNPQDRDAVQVLLAGVFEDGSPVRSENRMISKEGRISWVSWSNSLQVSSSGERLLRSIGRDITERKAVQEDLQARENFLRAITDNLPVAIAYRGRDWRYQFFNATLARRLGRSREEILGGYRPELLGEAVNRYAQWEQAAARGEVLRFEMTDMVDGEPRLLDVQVVPDMGEDGQPKGYYTVGSDITQFKAVERQLRELTEIIESSPDAVIKTDAQGTINYLNPSARTAFSLMQSESPLGRPFSDFYTPETTARFYAEMRPAIQRGGSWVGESTVRFGELVLPVNHLLIGHQDDTGKIVRYSSVMRDISAEVQARDDLQRQTATLGAVIEAMPAMIAVFDRQMRYRLVNRAFERWRGLDRDALVGHGVEETMAATEFEASRGYAEQALAGETVTYEKEYPNVRFQRHVSVTYVPLRLADGSIDGFIGVAHDVTSHREQESRLLSLSERDPLTGLMNRAGFARYLREHSGDDATLAILYIDLDHFKPINDTHGHAVGDELLQVFATRLQGLVRPTDACARLGGDEFAVALAGLPDRAVADVVADKVITAAHTPFPLRELELSIGASVGVAHGGNGSGGWERLLEAADERLYRAKMAGRGRRA